MRETSVPESAEEYSNHLKSLHDKRLQLKVNIAAVKSHRKSLSAIERNKILSKTDARCHICGGQITNEWEADHVLAYAAGGIHSIDNYLPAHSICNNYKWDYQSEEFQEILKLGVWIRTQIERKTQIGIDVAHQFIINEKRRIKRHVNSK